MYCFGLLNRAFAFVDVIIMCLAEKDEDNAIASEEHLADEPILVHGPPLLAVG